MTMREQNATVRSYFGEYDVQKRVYDALVSGGIVHRAEIELCRELAALAGSMYQRRSLSDADVVEMRNAVALD